MAANLTQEELAARADLSVNAITMLERGVRRAPRPGTVERLAQALELDAPSRAALVQAARGQTEPPGPPPPPAAEGAGRPDSRTPNQLPPDTEDFTGRAREVWA